LARFLIWLVAGLAIYFFYGRKSSKLNGTTARAEFPLPHRAVLYPQVLCWKPREPILSDTPTYRPLGVAGYLDRGLWDSPFWAMKLGRSRGAHRA